MRFPGGAWHWNDQGRYGYCMDIMVLNMISICIFYFLVLQARLAADISLFYTSDCCQTTCFYTIQYKPIKSYISMIPSPI